MSSSFVSSTLEDKESSLFKDERNETKWNIEYIVNKYIVKRILKRAKGRGRIKRETIENARSIGEEEKRK